MENETQEEPKYPVLRGTNMAAPMGPMLGASALLGITQPPMGPFQKTCREISNSHSERDPNGKPSHEPGSKLDSGKCAAGVLHDFALALQAVADVGDFGMRKYTRGGWQAVPNGEERYFDAAWRHLLKARHEELDPDSGLPHLAHLAWNILGVLELQGRSKL